MLGALPASEADMPATKDFVRAEIKDLRAEMIEKFATASTEVKRWFIGTAIGLASVVLAASNTTLPS